MSVLCNGQHWVYMLTCEEYAEFLIEHDERCALCNVHERDASGGKLHIDHEAGPGNWAVRGLLCARCNCVELFRRRNDPDVQHYLNNPWYQRNLPEPMAEPPVGTALSGRWGGLWVRYEDGWHTRRSSGIPWKHVVSAAGPHLRVVDRRTVTLNSRKPRWTIDECLYRPRSAPPSVVG